MRTVYTWIAAALFLLATPALAAAEGQKCGARTDVLTQLKEQYKEAPSGFGMTGNGAVIELTTSDSGSWTLLLSFPTGKTCMIATGENWEGRPKLPGRDA